MGTACLAGLRRAPRLLAPLRPSSPGSSPISPPLSTLLEVAASAGPHGDAFFARKRHAALCSIAVGSAVLHGSGHGEAAEPYFSVRASIPAAPTAWKEHLQRSCRAVRVQPIPGDALRLGLCFEVSGRAQPDHAVGARDRRPGTAARDAGSWPLLSASGACRPGRYEQ
jgi:hypothetical protein